MLLSQACPPDSTKLPWPPCAAPWAPLVLVLLKTALSPSSFPQPPDLQTALVPLALESGETDTSPSSSPLKAWSVGPRLMFSSPTPWDKPRQPGGGQSRGNERLFLHFSVELLLTLHLPGGLQLLGNGTPTPVS